MTTPYTVRPPNPFARRASTFILVLAALALVMGGSSLAVCINYPTLIQKPQFAEQIEEMRPQFPLEPRLMFGFFGTMVMTYAITGLTMGLLLRRANLVVIILTMVLTSGFMLFMTLNLVVNVARGDAGGMLVAAMLIAAHGAIIQQLIEALRFSSKSAVKYAPPPAYRAMQAYYLPPVQPAAR